MIYACIVCGEPQNRCGHDNVRVMTKDQAAELAFAYCVEQIVGMEEENE